MPSVFSDMPTRTASHATLRPKTCSVLCYIVARYVGLALWLATALRGRSKGRANWAVAQDLHN